MAIVHDRRIGRTRLRLARRLTETFPELKTPYVMADGETRIVDPLALTPQVPIYASPMYDCCSWDADLPLKNGGSYHVYSWDTMSSLARLGFDYAKEGYEVELSAL